jgi:L-rhamnose mutarotase
MSIKCEEEYNKWRDAAKDLDQIDDKISEHEKEFDKIWDEAWEENKNAMIKGLIYGLGYLEAGHPEIGIAFDMNELREGIHATDRATEKTQEWQDKWNDLMDDRERADSAENKADRDFCECAEENYGGGDEGDDEVGDDFEMEEEEEGDDRPKTWPKDKPLPGEG